MTRLAELRPRELEARLAEVPALIVPLGTIEWHSHHLPLGLDLIKAEAIAEEAAHRCRALLAPGGWLAAGGVRFPHTLRLAPEPVETVLADALTQLAADFRVLCVVNGHYGLDNTLAVKRAAARAMRESEATVLAIADYEVLLDLGARGDHAGVWETSLLWAARPELVALETDEELPGVIGDDPRGRASEELGRRGLALAGERVAAAVKRALSEEREEYAAALAAGIAALEGIAELRRRLPREQVPPVQTPSWLDHCRALHEGRYEEARAAAERKRADPAA